MKKLAQRLRLRCSKNPEAYNVAKLTALKHEDRKRESVLSNELNCLALWHLISPSDWLFFETNNKSMTTEYQPIMIGF